jgi:hypothetical protein
MRRGRGERRRGGAGASRGGVAPGRRGDPRRGGTGAGRRRGEQGQGRAGAQGRARRGEGEGVRREEMGRERERERGEGRRGELNSGIQLWRSPSPKPRAPREGERWERERLMHGTKSNEANGSGEGGAHGGGRGRQGRVGRTGPDRAGLGHITDRNPRHARPLNGLQSRTENQDGTRRTRNIRQRNAFRHDVAPMALRFCLHMTQTPVTILV